MASLRPVGDRILIRPDKPAAMTASGLHLPDVAQTRWNRVESGTVVAVGGRAPGGIKAGDRVAFNRYHPNSYDVEFEGEKLLCMRPREEADGDAPGNDFVFGVIE